MNIGDHKKATVFNLLLLALFLFMGGFTGLRLFLIYLALYFIPGYLVLGSLDYGELEKISFAIPVSYSFTILFFLLSRVGIRSINLYGIILLYALLLLFQFRKQIVRR